MPLNAKAPISFSFLLAVKVPVREEQFRNASVGILSRRPKRFPMSVSAVQFANARSARPNIAVISAAKVTEVRAEQFSKPLMPMP